MRSSRKRFGQHFLSDQTIIQQILSVLAPKSTDHLIEIGPGQGALTLPLLKKIHHLEAIELDRDLISALKTRANTYGELILYAADVLQFDLKQLKKDERLLRLFGNLPYNISTPLLFHVLNYASLILDMLFMLQKEVAERMAAKVDSPSYGRLSVMVQYHCHVELLFHVPPDAFFPPPQVQSSIIRLTPYHTLPFTAKDYKIFYEVVKHAFGQRRKTLRNSLKKMIDDKTWARINFAYDKRAEELSVQDFVLMSNAITP